LTKSKKYEAAKLSVRVANYYTGLLLSDSTIYTISSSSNGVVRAPSPSNGRHRQCLILQSKLFTHVHHTLFFEISNGTETVLLNALETQTKP